MTLVMTSGPALEPISVAEAKAHLRVDGGDEDALIASLIITSRLHVEAALGLALISQAWSYFIDRWPKSNEVALPLTPVQSIVAVRIWSADNTSPPRTTRSMGVAHHRAWCGPRPFRIPPPAAA